MVGADFALIVADEAKVVEVVVVVDWSDGSGRRWAS